MGTILSETSFGKCIKMTSMYTIDLGDNSLNFTVYRPIHQNRETGEERREGEIVIYIHIYILTFH